MDTKNYTGINAKNLGLKNESVLFGDTKLILLLAFHLLGGLAWIFINQVPPTWDAALHSMLSFKFLDYIQTNLSHFDIVQFLKISEYYPPFVHFTGVIGAFVSGDNYKVLQMFGLVYFLLSIVLLYLYTHSLFRNKTTAFLAAFFYSFFITNYQQSRDFMLDIPSIVFILAALLAHEKSDHFTKSKETLLYAVFVGIALLTKWTSVFYIIVPFIRSAVWLYSHKEASARVMGNLMRGAGIIFVICFPWYFVNFARFIEISRVTSIGEMADPQNLFSAANLLFNANLLAEYQLTFLGTVFFLVSTVIYFIGAHKKQKLIVMGTILLNYIVFTFISNKNIRYTMPITPFIAITMAYGAHAFLSYSSHVLRIFCFFIVSWFIFSYLVLSFGIPLFPTYRIGMKDVDMVYLDNYPVKVLYDTSNWHNTEILNTVYSSYTGDAHKDIVILNLIDREYMNWYNLDPTLYSVLSQEIRRRVKLSFVPFIEPYKTDDQMQRYLDSYIDYVLVPQKAIGLAEAIREYPHMQRFQTFMLKGKAQDFTPIASYSVPGNAYYAPDTYILYKKQTSP